MASRATGLSALNGKKRFREETRQRVRGMKKKKGWTRGYHQTANRLAWLCYFRCKRRLPAWLLNVDFVGDSFGRPGNRHEQLVAARGGTHDVTVRRARCPHLRLSLLAVDFSAFVEVDAQSAQRGKRRGQAFWRKDHFAVGAGIDEHHRVNRLRRA
jgi:hypothetical protein